MVGPAVTAGGTVLMLASGFISRSGLAEGPPAGLPQGFRSVPDVPPGASEQWPAGPDDEQRLRLWSDDR